MNPAFHRSMPIQTMASVMPDFFSAIDKYGDEGIPISTIMRDFTLDVLGHTAFGKPSLFIKICMKLKRNRI